jgi:uncharacterized protein
MEIIGDISYLWIIIFIGTGFLAGYIDSISGGGGMIQIPILLLSGIPPIVALAVNKIGGICGALMATVKYAISRKISYKIVKIAIVPCLLASYLGTQSVMFINDKIIEWLILVSIPIALIVLLNKRNYLKEQSNKVTNKNIILATSTIGFYDGLIGPGTGTYLTISMKKNLHLDYLTSTATTKPINFFTNLGSAIAFIIAGQVVWDIAISLLIGNIIGAYIGSHYAIKGGESFIKKTLVFILIFMLIANIIKIIFW